MTGIAPQGSTKSICWNYIKIISNDDKLFTENKHTHKCILCNWSASLSFSKSGKKLTVSYYTTRPNSHLLSSHSDIEEIAALKISSTEAKVKKEKEVEHKLLSPHVSSVSSTISPPPLKKSRQEILICFLQLQIGVTKLFVSKPTGFYIPRQVYLSVFFVMILSRLFWLL